MSFDTQAALFLHASQRIMFGFISSIERMLTGVVEELNSIFEDALFMKSSDFY